MENNENFVEQTENVEQTTEETVVEPAKVFTQDDLNAAVSKAKARERAKITKKFEREYGGIADVLRTGTGEEDLGKIADTFKKHYEGRGVKFESKSMSDRDVAVLAQADANEIINSGYEEVVEEVERLADIGVENMTAREKVLFKTLAEHRHNAERSAELSSIGVTEDVYNSQEFKDFASQFNPTIPVKDVYDIYRKTQPKKEIRTPGSMKNTIPSDDDIKDFYTVEEARRFTEADFKKNPKLFDKVVESSRKWNK